MQTKYTIAEVLRDRWWIGVVAMGVSLVLTPIVRFVAYRCKIVDRPDDLLKPHGRPVAYLGGVAMCAGLLVGLGAYVSMTPDLSWQWEQLKQSVGTGMMQQVRANPLLRVFAVGLGSVVITIVGLFDDVKGLTPRWKVFGQVLAAGILLLGGVGDRMAVVLLYYVGLSTYPLIVATLSAMMCFLVVIAACNATNLLDGLDGLCGGVTGIIALGFLGVAVWLAVWGFHPGTDELRVGLCLAMAGAVLGFLPYNIPPASIFMGDAGSMLLGFFVASMMVLFCQEGNLRWLVAACAVFALPILDTALAVVRRVRAGRSVFAGDRSHLYDQLVDRGMSVRKVVVLFYFLAVITAVAGVLLGILVRLRYALLTYAVALVIVWIIFFKRGMVTVPDSSQDKSNGVSREGP